MGFLFFSTFLVLSTHGYSQKIKKDGFTCSIKVLYKENLRTCGDVKIVYKGIIKVKSKSDLKGEYPFYFADMGNNISIFAVKNSENKILGPTLSFDVLKQEFYYKRGKKDEKKLILADEKTEGEIILEGMIFWLKLKTEKTKP